MAPDLSVVIVTYNSIKVIGGLLDSLPAAASGLSYDVIVVDNSSADGTAEYAEAHGGCSVIRSSNVGYAAGINLGVRAAVPAEAILVLNPDVRLARGSIPPLLTALGQPGVGIAVPQVRTPSGALDKSLRREPTLPRAMGLTRTGWPVFAEHLTDPADYITARDVDWALGAVMAVSRKCYEELGGWDESFFLYSEETDFCLRARDVGLATRYEPHSVATHIGGGSGRDHRTHAMQVVNRVRLYRRRHGPLVSWCYLCLNVASELSWVLRGHPYSRQAVAALLRPSRRPAQLRCGNRLMPS